MAVHRILTFILTFTLLTSVLAATPAGASVDDVLDAPLPVSAWTARGVPTERDLASVHFVNATLGYVGAEDGVVYRTTDGGRSWEIRHTGLFHPVNRMSWVDADTGWVIARDGAVARTTDGGDTWDVLDAGGWLGNMKDVAFVDAERGYKVGTTAIFRGYVDVTTDGGETWEDGGLDFPTTESSFDRVHFTEDGVNGWVLAWVFTEGHGVARTTDAGATWDFDVIVPGASTLNDMVMLTDAAGVLVGDAGRVYRTTDAGATWDPVPVPAQADLHAVAFADEENGWIVGAAGTVLATTDGGATWTLEASGTVQDLVDAAFAAPGFGWAIADAGEVRHRAPVTTLRTHVEPTLARVPTNPHPPIVVTGDGGFTGPLSGVTGGSGTADDPYVIEGWDIVPSAGDGITLVGTSAHVLIRGNTIRDAALEHSGIRLVDAENVRVTGNAIRNVQNGLIASDGAAVTLEGNVIEDVRRNGVDVTASTVVLRGNTVRGADGHGVALTSVPSAVVDGNALDFNRLAGVRVTPLRGVAATDVAITGNVLQDNRDGVHATAAEGLTIAGNVILLSERHGVNVELTRDARITGNAFTANAVSEVRVGTGAVDTAVTANALQPRAHGVLVSQAGATDVTGNVIHGGENWAVEARGSTGLVVDGNVVTGPLAITFRDGTTESAIRGNDVATRHFGIIVYGSDGNRVESNRVTYSGEIYDGWIGGVGVVIGMEAHGNVVRGNVLDTIGTGVSVGGGSTDTVVEANTLRDIGSNGISVAFYADGTVIRGNVLENVERHALGLLRRADNTVIEDNVIRNVTGIAFYAGSSSFVTFRNNTVVNATTFLLSEHACPMGEAYCDSEGNVIEASTIRDVATGVVTNDKMWGRTVDLVIRDTVIEDADTALVLNATEGTTRVTGVNLEDVATGIHATDAGTVDARGTWWGAADGPSGLGDGSGAAIVADAASDVTFAPWLTAPNPAAGA